MSHELAMLDRNDVELDDSLLDVTITSCSFEERTRDIYTRNFYV